MQILTARELEMLAKLCGMFSSHHPGEVANAAAMADRLLRQHGLRWSDVLRLPQIETEVTNADTIDDPFATWPGGWRAACAFTLRHRDVLSDWDRAWCEKVSRYAGNITSKQRPILSAIVDKVLAAGYRP
jgi:hypothetical protein